MAFYDVLADVVKLLQREGRASYRALKRQFHLGDDDLDDLKDAILYAHPVADDGRGFIWTGEPAISGPEAELRFRALLQAVSSLLKSEGRVTYRMLKHLPGLDDVLLADICKELAFKRLAIDEDGEGLVWTGETPSSALPEEATPSVPASPAPLSLVTASDTLTPPDAQMTPAQHVRSAPEAERRQLTVMFCDLVGSTDLSGKLDPEDLREVVRAYQEAAAEVVARYEGHIAQYLGDGLLIYFGWPQAHENDAERAIYSGLEIPEAIARLNTRLEADHGVQLAVRIGVHTGPVVVGEMGGAGRHENLALGETPNIAARLEGLAAPNTMVMSAMTAQLVQRSFVLEALGSHELKGVAEPMQVFGAPRPYDDNRDDEEDIPEGGAFLVGRDEELGLLMRRWEQSKSGLGQVVLLSGEAGIGKSSLMANLSRRVQQEGYQRLTLRCTPYTTNSALYPVIEYVQKALRWRPNDTDDAKLTKLEERLPHLQLAATDAVSLLASLLSLPVPEERYPALSLSPGQQRQQTQDVLVAWLLEEAEHQPALAVWEDLHWADPSTLELLGLLLEQAPTAAMLHVLSFRPEFEPPWPMRSHLTPIQLNHLERPQVEALIRCWSGDKALPVEVVEHIVAKTDGVPLFVEEMVKMLLASNLLREEAAQYVLAGPLGGVAIPDTLQDSLMARLDQLHGAKDIAQLGAVLGREFTFAMLQALASHDEATLRAGLDQLVEAELLYQRGRPPRARYVFKHALVRDTAYQSLLKRSCQDLHRQVATMLETAFAQEVEAQPELVAHHYTEALAFDQAISYWQRAGQQAAARSATAEALAHFTKGIELLTTLTPTPERQQRELQLQIALGTALTWRQGMASPDVGRVYRRALQLARHEGEPSTLFPILRSLWNFYFLNGESAKAHELSEELLKLSERLQDPACFPEAHRAMGTSLLWTGEYTSALSQFEQGISRYTPQQRQAATMLTIGDPGVICHFFSAHALWFLGYPDQAGQRARETLSLARALAHPFSLCFALNLTCWICFLDGDVDLCEERAEAGRKLASEHGFQQFASQASLLLGWVAVMRGQADAGLAQMREALAVHLRVNKLSRLTYLFFWTHAHWVAGRPADGLAILDEAMGLLSSELKGTSAWEEALYWLKGELLLDARREGQPADASPEDCFQTALDIARQRAAKSFELRAATSLARLWQSQGKCQEAYDLLAPVYGWFTEGFDTADFQDAKALLVALADQPNGDSSRKS